MSRVRLYIPAGRWSTRLPLDASERRHLLDVLRLEAGDRLEVFDGEGGLCQATLVRNGGKTMLELGPRMLRPDRGPAVRLGVALLKGRKLDQVVRMATEIGVDRLSPFTCERSVSRPVDSWLRGRLKRWETIAAEAARQSERTTIPELNPCGSLANLLRPGRDEPRDAVVPIMLHERADGSTLPELLRQNPGKKRFLLVGPEGGFTGSEVARARDAGFLVAGLGLPVLRAETAAIVAVALACLDRKPFVE